MDLTKRKREVFFWVLQFLGWFLSSASILIMVNKLSSTYITYTYFIGGLGGIIATSIYRVFLKKNIDIELFGKASVQRLIFAFVAASLFYYCLSFLSEEFYDVFWIKSEEDIKMATEKGGIIIALIGSMMNILLWTLIYFVIKFVMKANQDSLRSISLNTSLKEAQLNTLKGQVNPHFMFNSLNNIRGLMLEDVEKSSEMITKLSEMLEYALEKNSVDKITVQEELAMVENYIALSKIQMEDRLQFIKQINPETLSIDIPPMIIQLLVENAAKHGISNLKNGGSIVLKTEKSNNYLSITVENTGKLRIDENSTQLGLKNIKQRLRLLYGQKAAFTLKEGENKVVANIKIPLA
jgi:two-component sensor histidine kinase